MVYRAVEARMLRIDARIRAYHCHRQAERPIHPISQRADGGFVANLAPLEHERNDALHTLLVRPILLRKVLAHELFFFAQLYPKTGECEDDGDKSAQMPEGDG